MNPDRLRGLLGYQTALLGVAALSTAAALALANLGTAEHIAAAEASDLRLSLAQVLPGEFDGDLLADTLTLDGPNGPLTVYRARRGGQVAAVVFRVSGPGYAGPIDCMMGVDRDGRVTGVRVLKHKETPGLGDKIEVVKGRWIESFAGKSLAEPEAARWAVKKDGGVFDQFAGATITPRGVVKAVKGGLAFFAKERDGLLDGGPVGAASRPRPVSASVDRGREAAPTKESP